MISIRERAPAKTVGKGFLDVAALEPFPPRQGQFRDGANGADGRRQQEILKCGDTGLLREVAQGLCEVW